MPDIQGLMGLLDQMGGVQQRPPQYPRPPEAGTPGESQAFRDWLATMRIPPDQLTPDVMVQAYQMWSQMRLQQQQMMRGQ
jgi:hypothetical protein